MDENYAMRLHEAFSNLGIKYAVLDIDNEMYQYISLSATECQFGLLGDILTNYSNEENENN